MAIKVVADPDARTITVLAVPVNGEGALDVVDDIYTPLKDDWQGTPTLQRLRFPFRTFGDPTGAAQIGPYVFFDNISGWRFVPYDADYELTLVGNLIAESAVQQLAGYAVWNARAGRTIVLREQQSAQALTKEVTLQGVGTPDAVADAVWGGALAGPSGGGTWAGGTFGFIQRKLLTVAKFIGLK